MRFTCVLSVAQTEKCRPHTLPVTHSNLTWTCRCHKKSMNTKPAIFYRYIRKSFCSHNRATRSPIERIIILFLLCKPTGMKNARMKILSGGITVTVCFCFLPFFGADSLLSSRCLSATMKHSLSASILRQKLPLMAATVETSSSLDKTDKVQVQTSVNAFVEDVASGWECNEEAECVKIPACDGEQCQTSLDVRIHNTWYDLSGWRKAHPAGSHWIDWYDGRDATEVMDAFHSKRAREMYKRLPKSKPANVQFLSQNNNVPDDTPTQIAFRKLREQLEADGWWERDWKQEVTLLTIWLSLCVGAAVTASAAPALSVLLASLAFTNAGWLGHDYIHGVDEFSDKMRLFAALAAGLGITWWSDKHNKHHALTNELGVDEDLATDPFLYTWPPDPQHDSPLRKIQHWIFFIPFSFLFALWRLDSIQVSVNAVEEKRPNAKKELYAIMVHYLVALTVLPIQVFLPAVLLSGFMSAMIVTPTHQSEELFTKYQPDWVTAQFRSTRNAVMSNPFSEWLWGGMQYQLEHHLFPSMPRSKYPLLKPILEKFALENNIPGGYKESGEFEILKMNWELYKRVAESDPVDGALYSRGTGQLGAINLGYSPAKDGFLSIKK